MLAAHFERERWKLGAGDHKEGIQESGLRGERRKGCERRCGISCREGSATHSKTCPHAGRHRRCLFEEAQRKAGPGKAKESISHILHPRNCGIADTTTKTP